ncbi:MAG TPA: Gfo/Idh/MocA family oxidoreductase [Bacillota bacterium]|nr:Gfo/Idh/MocA family oxidoreductase [Bacillota bacterium]
MSAPKANLTRRSFLARTTASVAAFSVVPSSVLGLRGAQSPNSKLNIAAIGLCNQGGSDLQGMTSENIVALCDVDTRYTAKHAKQFPQAKQFRDFRKMFDQMDKEIDAVLIATPDHWHATLAMRAMKMGKHVYCEKPLAHSIYEVRALMQAARELKVTTQLGNQGHSFDTIRVFREWVEDGAVGTVREVHAMCRSVYSQVNRLDEVKRGEPVPESLDWDLWVGPAQFRPFHSAYHPGKWRSWTNFGTGVIGDWTCHVIDPVFWTLDLGTPTTIEALEPSDFNPATQGETFPAGNMIRYTFPAKGNRAAVTLTWYDGAQKPPRPAELEADEKLPDIGALVVGDKAKIMYGSHGAAAPQILRPDEETKQFKRTVQRYPRSPGHPKEWIQACKVGKPAGSDFSYGGPLSEIALLGVIAMRFRGQKLQWDSARMQFTNCSGANDYLKPTFRKGWEL